MLYVTEILGTVPGVILELADVETELLNDVKDEVDVSIGAKLGLIWGNPEFRLDPVLWNEFVFGYD